MASQNKREISDGELKHELTGDQLDALLERAVAARERKEREEKIRKAGGALSNQIGVYKLEDTERFLGSPCGPLCLTPSQLPPRSMEEAKRLQPGTVYAEVHEGDPVPQIPWRKVSAEEAADVLTWQDEVRLLERRQNLGEFQQRESEVFAEYVREEETIETHRRRLAELDVDRQKARARTEEATGHVDELFATKSEKWKRDALPATDELYSAIVASIPDRRMLMAGIPIGPPPKMPRPLGAYGEVPPATSARRRRAARDESGEEEVPA